VSSYQMSVHWVSYVNMAMGIKYFSTSRSNSKIFTSVKVIVDSLTNLLHYEQFCCPTDQHSVIYRKSIWQLCNVLLCRTCISAFAYNSRISHPWRL